MAAPQKVQTQWAVQLAEDAFVRVVGQEAAEHWVSVATPAPGEFVPRVVSRTITTTEWAPA